MTMLTMQGSTWELSAEAAAAQVARVWRCC